MQQKVSNSLSFEEAIKLGEYKPEFLSKYPEWKQLSPYTQLQYIKQAMDNRRKRLTQQMGELYNVLDFSLKPDLKEAIANIHKHLNKIEDDKEKYFIEYTKKI